jgi:GntR family transcriptional regulator, arabinose operon transcriptional repressor
MDSIRKDSPIPIYKQLADTIRDQVLKGELEPGDQLPGEWELAKLYKISRSSVRRTIDLLVNSGMVVKIHGKGNFIQDWTEMNSKGGVIALLVPDSKVFLFSNVLNGALNAAKSRGYTLIISFLGRNETEEEQNLDLLRQHGVSGFVIFPRNNITYDPVIWRLYKENFPFVLIDRYFPELPCPFVGIDNVQAAFEVVNHLAGLGYRAIGFATTTWIKTITVRERFEGYQKALNVHGIEYNPRWFFDTQLSSASPVIPEEDETGQIEIFRNLYRERGHPEAIFSINDITAYLLGKAAKAEDIAIPADMALAGMDDDEYARRTEVPLTTMRQPFEEIGARATHILIDHLRGSPSGIERVFLSTQLVIRQSCGGALLHQNQTTAES